MIHIFISEYNAEEDGGGYEVEPPTNINPKDDVYICQ